MVTQGKLKAELLGYSVIPILSHHSNSVNGLVFGGKAYHEFYKSTIEPIVEYRMPQQWPQHNKLPILLYLRYKLSGLVSATNMPIKIACITVYMFYEERIAGYLCCI
jgi:hypothetical protein